MGKINQEGLNINSNQSYILRMVKLKFEIAVGKGKKLYDKRQVKKKRDWNREKQRIFSKFKKMIYINIGSNLNSSRGDRLCIILKKVLQLINLNKY